MKNRLTRLESNQHLNDIDLRRLIWRSAVNAEIVERISVWVVQTLPLPGWAISPRNGESRDRTCTVASLFISFIKKS
jgi:hypothetical protein